MDVADDVAAGRGRGAYISLTNGLHGRGGGADTRFGWAAGGAGPCFQKALLSVGMATAGGKLKCCYRLSE